MGSIRVFVKRQVQLNRLSFGQRQMLKLGTVGIASVINRARGARNTQDTPSKPLTKKYAIRKSKRRRVGLGAAVAALDPGKYGAAGYQTNKRDLTFTGNMLRNWKVRTVSDSRATASWSTLKDRIKARANEKIEKFIDYSPANVRDVMKAAQPVVAETVARLVVVKGAASERSSFIAPLRNLSNG